MKKVRKKNNEVTGNPADLNNGREAKPISYYYDDSHGYQAYDPADEEDETRPLHRWDLTQAEAIELQKELAHRVIRTDDFPQPVRSVAGIDLGYDVAADTSRAVVAVLEFPGLEVIEIQEALMPIQFPYIPGLLSFREIPVVIEATGKLENIPDLILYDGVGIAHPRRFGIASHVGVVTDIPTIGVAKSLLTGNYEGLGEERGSTAPIMSAGEVIGMALRTRPGVKPVFVSIGHRISLETAVDFVLRCTTKYRLPETTRLADKLASYRKTRQPSLF
jgi:deoxyribonuclease V